MATEIEQLTAAINELRSEIRGGNSGPRTGSGSHTTPSYSAGPSLGGMIPVVDKLTAATSGINNAIGNWQKASADHGIAFNNDALGLTNSVSKTRLSMDDWDAAIESGKVGFTSLGGTMSDSARAFNKLSSEFSDSKFADPLREMGVTTSEYNQLLSITVSGNKKLSKDDAESKAQAFQATNDLAMEMDKVAQMTGISRKEQMKSLEDAKLNARVQASIEQKIKAGGADVADSYKNMNVQMKGLGLNKLTDELFTGQKLTKESNAQLVALGPAGTKLKAAMSAISSARGPTEKAAAESQLQSAKAAVADQMKSDSFQNMVIKGEGDVTDAARDLYMSTKNYTDGITQQAEKMGVDTKTAQKQVSEQVDASHKGEKITDGEKKKVAGADSTKAAVRVKARIEDIKAFPADTLQAMNEKAGEKLAGSPIMSGLENVKKDKTGKDTGFLERKGGLEFINELPKSIKNGDWDAAPAILKQAGGELLKVAKDLSGGAADILVHAIAGVTGTDANKSMGPGEIIPDATTAEQTKKPKFSSGSKDVLGGEWFGNFGAGTDVTVHGNEAIVPKNKLEEFSADMFGKNLSSGSSSISGKSPATTPADVKQAPSAIAPIKPTEPKVEEKSPITPDYKKVSGMGGLTNEKIKAALDKTLTTGNQTPEIKTPPIEVAKPKAADLTKPKVEEPVKPKVEEPKIAPQTATITLKDLNDQLTKLNTTMNKLANSHTELVQVNEKTLRATKKNSNDLNQH